MGRYDYCKLLARNQLKELVKPIVLSKGRKVSFFWLRVKYLRVKRGRKIYQETIMDCSCN